MHALTQLGLSGPRRSRTARFVLRAGRSVALSVVHDVRELSRWRV